MILLDTHILIWLAEDDVHLGRQMRETIGSAAAGDVIVSAISFWEIGMLLEKRRIALSLPLADFARSTATRPDLKVVPVSTEIAVETADLPHGLPGDPGDRILVATARHLGCPLATTDRKILAYSEQGHVQALDARR